MKQKPFDLEAALAGKPVLLRNGSKAYVKFIAPNSTSKDGRMTGYRFDDRKRAITSWSIDGKFYCNNDSRFDIVGMYLEIICIGNINVSRPETEPPEIGAKYYYPEIAKMEKYGYDYWTGSEPDNRLLKDGLIHLTEKGAIAHAEALIELTKTALNNRVQ